MRNYFILTILFIAGFMASCTKTQQKELKLWYTTPASVWEETLPLGNGRLGMMPGGRVIDETIVLNDVTMWSGSPQDANNYSAWKNLPRIRELLLAGKNDQAQELINKDFICSGPGSGGGNGANVQFGCYQILGNLHLDFAYEGLTGKDVHYENYQRELSISNAIAACTYQVNGVTYNRESLTSFDDDLGIIRITADKEGQINCKITLSRQERAVVTAEGSTVKMVGQLNNGIDGNGMRLKAIVKAVTEEGNIATVGDTLTVSGASELILYVSAGTDFKDSLFEKKIQQILSNAEAKPYNLQKKNHINNYKKLFDRVSFSLGGESADGLTTDQRLQNYKKYPEADLGLPVLFYQFGRYLSICSTRVGLLPPNLQGLWANQVQTPWNGDYHLDVNIQMNQWPVEVSNLSEFNLPLAELVKGMVKSGEKTAQAYYNAKGWVAHVITNVWGYTEPGESASWGITKSGSGWLCNNLWEHYAFTGDTAYLRDIYPVLKGSAEFYESTLIYDPETGWMVTAPSSSPENSFYLPNGKWASVCLGPTIDNQIMHELFSNVITASEVLGVDAAFSDRLKVSLTQIPPAGVVGSDGRLMEWLKEYDEPEPHHRHVSHLYGLFPAPLITPDTTPDLAEACKKTLEKRGDDGPSWSIAFKLLFWARLHDGERAYKLYKELMKPTLETYINYGAGGGVYPNLLSAGPPFQIDGNFGGTAGIAEMLLQSHAGFIDLLPAIPSAWSSGEVKGLKARGNFTVDIKWENGTVIDYLISSPEPQKVKVRVNGEMMELMSRRI